MLRVSELRLVRPLEVMWESAFPVPRITLRNPDCVHYDPETRLLHVDTGRTLVLMPLDAESVDRMVLEPTGHRLVATDGETRGYLVPTSVAVQPPSSPKASASPSPTSGAPAHGSQAEASSPPTVLVRKKPTK